MVRVLLVNNYRDSAESKIGECLKALRECLPSGEVEVVGYSELEVDAVLGVVDAVVLSGSSASVCQPDTIRDYASVIELVRRADTPIIGICFGHQLIAYTFGTPSYKGRRIRGERQVEVLEPDEIFSCCKAGDKILVSENHMDYVERLPHGFIHLARSEDCEIEAMKHGKKPIYGVQFHPERVTCDGRMVLKNFFYCVVRR